MKYFTRLGFILLVMSLFQNSVAFAGAFSITAIPQPATSGFSLNSQAQYTSVDLNGSPQAFPHFATIVAHEDIYGYGSHTIRVTVQNNPGNGTIIAVNKRIENETGYDWDSILVEIEPVNGAAAPTLDTVDPLYIAGTITPDSGTDIGGPKYDPSASNPSDVTLGQNSILFNNPQLYEIDGLINLWFTVALPVSGFYQFDITQTFTGQTGPNSSVPEPGLLALVGLGLLSAGFRKTKHLTIEVAPSIG